MEGKMAQAAEEWVFVARSVAVLADSQNQALRCMARAGVLARDVHDWVTVAVAWAQDFLDPELALQCMSEAQSQAEDSEDSDDWLRISGAWAEMGHCNKAAEIVRKHIEPRTWQYLAELQNRSAEFPPGTTALDWIEPGMTRRASRDLVEEAREQINSSYFEAIRLLVEAEALADSSRDWTRIARAWVETFQDSDSAEYCMEKAEDSVDSLYDWVLIAKAWAAYFGDSDAAIRCMEEAEDEADTFEDYSEIEEAWRQGIQGLDSSIRNNALQRILNKAEVEEYGDVVLKAITDQGNREQGAVVDLGVLTGPSVSQVGTWGNECLSRRREGSYARYYSFTLARAAEVTIDLTSPIDTYLYLISGDVYSGEVLDEDDDGLNDSDSRITCSLAAGAYAVEVTTFPEEEAGAFTLEISLSSPA